MKLFSIFAMVTTLTGGAKAISSPTRGAHWQPTAALVRELRKHPAQPQDNVAPMLKSAEAMLLGLANNHTGTPLHDLVEQIRPFILDMQESIRTAHTSAQQTLTNFGDDFAGCNTARTAGEAEGTSLETTKTSHSSAHKTCRTQQKSAHDQHSACESTMSALQTAADTACQLFENSKRTPGCGDIPPNPGETWESYVTRAATWFAEERDGFMQKKAFCNNETAALEAQRTICVGTDGSGGHQKEFEDKKQECDDIQGQLESATCAYVSKVDNTCENFATCTNSLADALDEQLADIRALERQRKVEWNATERLLCMLGAYGADGGVDASKLQTCQSIADNTSHLSLSYPAATSRPSPCPELLPHPCGDDYTADEYDGLDAPAATCTPCTFPANANSPAANSPAAAIVPGAWLHLDVASVAASASDGDQIHTWPAVNDAAMDMIAGDKPFGFTDVEFKTSGPFSGRPAMVFTGRHIMCTASSHPVPQELTVFWKGTFDSTVDPAHQQRTNRARVIEQEVWALELPDDDDRHIQVYKQGQDWNKCKGEAAPNEPIIVVGTFTGNTRTLKVYRDSDMSVISTVANSLGPPLEAGKDKKICMGYSHWNYNSLGANSLHDRTHWRGEFEKVVVYDKVLGEQEITQVVNSLHNPQASAAGPPAPAPGPPGQPVTATIASCTASSHRGHYVCDKVFDGVLAERGRGKDNNEWATEREGVGSWIELNFDHATKINAMKYANRDAWTTDGEANRRVKLEFSAGSPAFVELVQPSTVDDDWDQQYFFPDVETTFVKITVETVWGTFNNGAEEIEFSYVPQGTYVYVEGRIENCANTDTIYDTEESVQAACSTDDDCKGYWQLLPPTSGAGYYMLKSGTRTFASGVPAAHVHSVKVKQAR